MKFVYKLEHKRIAEINDDTGEKIPCTKLLGFFPSEEKCKEIIPLYLDQPGFRDYPDDFIIEKIEADVDDYNGTAGEFNASVFYLSHEYYDGVYDHISHPGYYSTQKLAEQAQQRYQLEPEFIAYPDGFCIAEYKIGKREWKEGFFAF